MKKNNNWFLINGHAKNMKPHCTLDYLQGKFPEFEIVKIGKPPGMTTLSQWVSDGVAKATDGCRVEPDGSCEHGHDSWLLALGFI
jgi:hypothetical protein